MGFESSAVWVHNRTGERQIAFPGLAFLPSSQRASRSLFSPDGTKLFFLGRSAPGDLAELWVADLNSGRTERLFPGLPVAENFDVSPDGKQIVLDSP